MDDGIALVTINVDVLYRYLHTINTHAWPKMTVIDCIYTSKQGTRKKEMSYDEDGCLWVKLNSIEEASTEKHG